jgi:hypothetical protein
MSILPPAEIGHIDSTLPPQFAALKDRYPYAIVNAADHWNQTPFPVGYVPHSIDIYYGDEVLGPDISIENGLLVSVRFPSEESAQSSVIQLDVDGRFAYIQIEGIVILNLLSNVVLPNVLVDQFAFLKATDLVE